MSRTRRLLSALTPARLRSRLGLSAQPKPRLKPEDWLKVEKRALIDQLCCHAPFSEGTPTQRLELTLNAAASCYQTLRQFLESQQPDFFRSRFLELTANGSAAEERLKHLFNQQGSDKASSHSYHILYSRLVNQPALLERMLEIGIGTNNPGIISNMTASGTPGASLRAWQEFMPKAAIFGADVDNDILFQEGRISCHHVDQLSLTSLESLADSLGANLDLIIDDGLHSIQANLQTLQVALRMCKPTGWICIEDIFPPQSDFFLALSWILNQQGIESRLYRFDKPGMIFLVSPQRSLASFPQ
jgi:hypothetical protein